MDEEIKDEDLMLAYAGGDASAFEVLFNRYQGPLIRFCNRQCHDSAVADEIFQDTWMNIIRSRKKYVPTAKFKTFLFKLARNRLIDYYRSAGAKLNGLTNNDSMVDPDELPCGRKDDPVYENVKLRARVARFMEIVNNLSPKHREIFLLHEESGMNLDEMADVLDINRETAKSRLRYALLYIRRGMGSDG